MRWVIILMMFLLIQEYHLQKYMTPKRPEDYISETYRYQCNIILNMTYLIAKDATIKLWHADRVQQRYLGTLSYELGTIAAGIQDQFRKMLQIYRKFSNLSYYRGSYYYGENDIVQALHLVKGLFNSLIIEKDMFVNVLKTHAERNLAGKTTRQRIGRVNRDKRRRASLAEKEAMLRRRLHYEKWTEEEHFDLSDLNMGDLD